ncbi:MAG TPA: glycerophosphodiester phosphodiesterase family protein [Candidatus Nanoarchaeia archaeon]|nr:glycerophosphodiester phosphodiesterase family protein [Candidatus Nanoarchaeia archaeon]
MIQTIGHRGAAALEPENTLRGFRKAIELGLDYVELDIRRCKSGELVVIHDEAVDRTTSGKGLVEDRTLQQLQKLDAGKSERIPALKEAIDLCKGKIGMIIELKEAGMEEDVVELAGNEWNGRLVISSFFHKRVKRAKELAETKRAGVKTAIINLGNPVNIVEIVKGAKADIYLTDRYYIDARTVDNLRRAGIIVAIGGGDTEKDIRSTLQLKPDMLSSDRPDLLLKVLRRK